MKINIKARLRNKTFLVSSIAMIIAFIYQALALFNIVPDISESAVVNLAGMLIDILALFGILVDPTTAGVSDSEKA